MLTLYQFPCDDALGFTGDGKQDKSPGMLEEDRLIIVNIHGRELRTLEMFVEGLFHFWIDSDSS